MKSLVFAFALFSSSIVFAGGAAPDPGPNLPSEPGREANKISCSRLATDPLDQNSFMIQDLNSYTLPATVTLLVADAAYQVENLAIVSRLHPNVFEVSSITKTGPSRSVEYGKNFSFRLTEDKGTTWIAEGRLFDDRLTQTLDCRKRL